MSHLVVVLVICTELVPSSFLPLQELSHSISAAHRVLWVMGREQDVAEARMLLFWAARKSLESGLKILGLAPLQRM